jgi:hypothetical protein
LLRQAAARALAAPGGHDHHCHVNHADFASISRLSLSAFRPEGVLAGVIGHEQFFAVQHLRGTANWLIYEHRIRGA